MISGREPVCQAVAVLLAVLQACTNWWNTCKGAAAARELTRWSCRLMAVTSAAMAIRDRSSALSGATIQTSCVQRRNCSSALLSCPVHGR